MQSWLKKKDIKRLRGDLSPFLIHLTRNGTYKRWEDIPSPLEDDGKALNAEDSLRSIIESREIQARSPFGYFNFSVSYKSNNPNSKIQRSWLKSVCFTETPIDHIHIQFNNILGRHFSFQKYGLAFFEESIRSHLGNPVMYFNTVNKDMRDSLDTIPTSDECSRMKHILPFFEGFGPPLFPKNPPISEIDFRWEREWRIVGNFSYSLESDVAFGICPIDKVKYFEESVSGQFPFIDPSPEYIEKMKVKLKSNERLKQFIS